MRPTWTSFDVRDYTVNVYSKDVINIYDSTGKTSFFDISTQLASDLSTALSNTSKYALEAGGWYNLMTGYYDPAKTTYFTQFSGPTKAYNMNVTLTFTSFDSTAYTNNLKGG